MRTLVLIMSVLMLALIGPAGAGRASEWRCVDLPMAMQGGPANKADCSECNSKVHKCVHEACCVPQLVAISEQKNLLPQTVLRVAATTSIVKCLTSLGRDALLEPPRA